MIDEQRSVGRLLASTFNALKLQRIPSHPPAPIDRPLIWHPDSDVQRWCAGSSFLQQSPKCSGNEFVDLKMPPPPLHSPRSSPLVACRRLRQPGARDLALENLHIWA